eukprot:TRINITY_DN44875_c0_g1_i1.p1 TRINITY_DN44875_c0_g1~~TRINITY_DN44875_c0_g1_i1.p1  ORF type:complete len:1072 (+),score=226.13 TRINITY_DN44875_c0_g1_i1:47-3262(+)
MTVAATADPEPKLQAVVPSTVTVLRSTNHASPQHIASGEPPAAAAAERQLLSPNLQGCAGSTDEGPMPKLGPSQNIRFRAGSPEGTLLDRTPIRSPKRNFTMELAASNAGSEQGSPQSHMEMQEKNMHKELVDLCLEEFRSFVKIDEENAEMEAPKEEVTFGGDIDVAEPDQPVRFWARRTTNASQLFEAGTNSACCLNFTRRVSWLVGLKRFIAFFMALTFYALFAPDLDQWFGDQDSYKTCGIVSSVVFLLFVLEIVLQCIGKRGYVLQAYFWLDLVAALSLLPDTYFVQQMLTSNAFAAGRSSRFARLMRLASRSTKATRLNRLVRIARIAALVPKLAQLLGNKVKEEDVSRVIDKHMRRAFQCLDDDADGQVLKADVSCVVSAISKIDLQDDSKRGWILDPRDAVKSIFKRQLTVDKDIAGPLKQTGNGEADDDFAVLAECINYECFCETLMQHEGFKAGLRKAAIAELTRNANRAEMYTSRHSERIGVKVALGVVILLFVLIFLTPTLADDSMSQMAGLEHLQRYLGARIANETISGRISVSMQQQVNAWTEPFTGDFVDRFERDLRYLDLDRLVYCNELVRDATSQPCAQAAGSVAQWSERTSMDSLIEQVSSSDLRPKDVLILLVAPTINEENSNDLSIEEFNARTLSVAVLDAGRSTREEAMWSVMTTCCVMVLILGSILALTKDLTFLSVNLLGPVKELAYELDNIVQKQLAAVADDKAPGGGAKNGAGAVDAIGEIRFLQRSFETMKRAIKSWGKYVPWPVVHLMLRENVAARLEVKEQEVTMFFSDIVSFTSIVEGLPPERSLLLLSRYFHDMSLIIDKAGGIVIEYIGDAILCVYGAPVRNPYHPLSAVSAALEMQSSLVKMNAWLTRHQLPTLAVRCGLHTGPALVGNMGFESRMKYGIIGENTEVPSKLEELNKTYGTLMLISETLHQRLVAWEEKSGRSPTKAKVEEFVMRPVDIIHLRPSVARPETIWEVRQPMNDSSAHEQLMDVMYLHTEGMVAYRDQNFEEALKVFEAVAFKMRRLFPTEEDGPSALMVKRCQYYLRAPPRADWSGVWNGPG